MWMSNFPLVKNSEKQNMSGITMAISIAKPQIDEEEVAAVTRVLRSGMIASGPETREFEREFSNFVGCEYACAVNNGTSALSLALLAVGVGPGDEVITSPMTFVATANSILSCGATPVFSDVDEATFNLSPSVVKSAITGKTKAIMPVHLYGHPAEMGEFRRIADEYNLAIIGDAAQAHGAAVASEMVGSLADVECFSFYPTKNMTTGEGGMVTTNDEELYSKMNSIRNHGRPDNLLGVYEHDRFGLNLRLTDIGSAIGRVQLAKLPELNRIRARNANAMSDLLEGTAAIVLPTESAGVTHSWHQYTIRVSDRDGLSGYLKERDIGCGIYYPRLIQDYPHLEKFRSQCPVAENVVSEVISLPIHPGLTLDDIEKVARAVIGFIEG